MRVKVKDSAGNAGGAIISVTTTTITPRENISVLKRGEKYQFLVKGVRRLYLVDLQ